ncbi:MAG: VCBS repeat-containing protein [Flavipsychrobacter sp.]|nr:VCBS repeat-containing protein [Flavipsychrobacter sp.]
MKRIGWLYFVLLGCLCCKQQTGEGFLFEELSVEHTGVDFTNEIREDEQLNILSFEYFYNGAGVGVADFNQDSLPDLFFASNMGASRLYLNKGNFQFLDNTESSGIDTRGKWATGVSIVDINQDGYPDIYLCFAGPHGGALRANALYVNDGKGRFTDQAATYGLADTGHTVQAVFFDYDRDDDLDCYLLTNSTDEMGPNIIRPKRVNGEMENTDRLYRNEGNGTFRNVSREAGILKEGYGLGVAVADVNRDGWPDIFVSNDYLSNDLLYINNHDGTFSDKASTAFKHTSYSAMGNDVGDINNDGWPDLVEVDMLPPDNYRQKLMLGFTNHDRYRSELQVGYDPQFMRNSLHLNQGRLAGDEPSFSEIGQLAGIAATDWSWSPLLADYDLDGRRDLFITNGYPRDITNRDFITYQAQGLSRTDPKAPLTKEQFSVLQKLEGAYLNNFIFRNEGDFRFSDQSGPWGFSADAYSTGAAYADFDNDGDLDLVVVNTGKPASLYRNNAAGQTKNNFIRLRLQGKPGNLDGIGARCQLYAGDQVWYAEQQVIRGYQSSVDNRILIGLGSVTGLDSIVITWPDGRQQTITSPAVNSELHISYKESRSPFQLPTMNEPNRFIASEKEPLGITFMHHETPYTDFNIQPLLPHKFSIGGPPMAVGDLNGDRRDDFFVGGAYNQSGLIYLQQQDGHFQSKPLDEGKKLPEDMGAVFLDADGDGDLDLYVVSGGNEFPEGSVHYQDRLYLNNGRGGFTLSKDLLPAIPASGSVAVATDFDRDGDMDLFVGGRIRPQHYPEGGTSQLLENRNGRFVQVAAEKAPGLDAIGMVNGAVWVDLNQDGWVDLVVVGEWMPVTVFMNRQGRFENSTEKLGLAKTVGWWNTVQVADCNEDGQPDLVLGNHGLNSRYARSDYQSLGVYWYDFSKTGTRHGVISYSTNGEDYPIHPRDDLMMQLPFLRKKFPLYTDYAKARMQDLFPQADLNAAEFRQLNEWRSGVLLNGGDNAWQFFPFPMEAQFAPVNAMLVDDWDSDGKQDILLTGNDFGYEVINGPADALNGLSLYGTGDGRFNVKRDGFRVTGEGRSLIKIVRPARTSLILAGVSNGAVRKFEVRREK